MGTRNWERAWALGVLAGLTVGCAGVPTGGATRAVRPNAPTAADALQEPVCREVSARGEPLVVDWKSHQRGDLEEAMADGVAMVRYDCSTLEVLKNCRVDGGYSFLGLSRKEEAVRLSDADEIAANLPAFGARIASELGRDAVLDLAMITVGKVRTTVRSMFAEDLSANPSCRGATHYVRGAFVGAFAMDRGTRGKARVATNLWGAGAQLGSASSMHASNRDGSPDQCRQAERDDKQPVAGCSALLRLELIALSAPQDATESPAACPTGLVLVHGKCASPSDAEPRQCRPRDAQDCTRQCDRGHALSCSMLADLLEGGRGAPADAERIRAARLREKGCDGGVAGGCFHAGWAYDSGLGVEKDRVRASALYEKACDAGHAIGCFNLGNMLAKGDVVPKDEQRAGDLYERGCNAGDHGSCLNLGMMYAYGRASRHQDRVIANGYFARACEGGEKFACHSLAESSKESADVVLTDDNFVRRARGA